jgi:GT2 family glycosyltransferase
MIANSISVIVPTIGRAKSLTHLLTSLAAQSLRPDEVIVADGSSAAEVTAVVDQPQWGTQGLNVRRVAVHPPNAVRQRVAAIAESAAEYLLLLDDDVVLEPDCVEQLMAALADQPGVVGAFADFNNQAWPEPTLAWRLYMRLVLGIKDRDWQGQVLGPLLRFGYSPPPTAYRPIAWLGTCNTLIRRSAYDRVGGFSDFFLHRCTINEDVDLGLKLSTLGGIVFCSRARLSHFHAPEGRVSPAVAAEDDLFNRYLVMRRTQGREATAAFGQVVVYFLIETGSNFLGGLRRWSWGAFWPRTLGRLRALARICGVGPAA